MVLLYMALVPPNKLLIRSCSLGFDGCWTCGLPGRRPPHEVKVDDDDDENAWLRPLARLLNSEEERDASPQSVEIEWGRLIKTICTWTVGETDCQWCFGGHRQRFACMFY